MEKVLLFHPLIIGLKQLAKRGFLCGRAEIETKEDYKITISFSQIAVSEFLSSLEKL